MAEAHATKWKSMKKSFLRLHPDADSLRQHCLRADYLACLVWHPSLKHHPSPIGHGWNRWMVAVGQSATHNQPALPTHLPSPPEVTEEDNSDENNDVQGMEGNSSEEDDSEYSDSDW